MIVCCQLNVTSHEIPRLKVSFFRIITSDWGLADWVQRLIGANKVCYASEVSRVDPANRTMEMHSRNLSFNSYVNMEERMTYTADPEDGARTLLRQEMLVTVQGVPLTSYMEGIIVNTVSNNSSKGKAAIEWVVDKLGQECRWVLWNFAVFIE